METETGTESNMPSTGVHTHILPLPYGENLLAGAQLDLLVRAGADLVVDFHELHLTALPQLFEKDGAVYEQVAGMYVPRRLRFIQVAFLEGGAFALDAFPPGHPARAVTSSLQWRAPDGLNYYLIFLRDATKSDLLFTARRCVAEERGGPRQPVAFNRNWSPSPASPPRLVPKLSALHQLYGGDPVAVALGKRMYKRRLFIGGVDIHPEQRPQVDAVLNLGEVSSRWVISAPSPAGDRWTEKGEGAQGMNVEDIRREAAWVIERLQAGQRVLVHCAAGMNRSATICCAVLILLEGLSAEAALERVRQYHPWARPDSRHWLELCWLAQVERQVDDTISS